jgi:DNA-binding transcriptional regulator YiaG
MANRIKELRHRTGLSQPAFGKYFGIPSRTIQNWELEVNQCAEYLVDLMEYKLKNEGMIKGED